MKGYAYIRNSLFDHYYEQEESGMTEADLITYIALQMGMENNSLNTVKHISEYTGYGEAQISQSLKKLEKFKCASNSFYENNTINLHPDGKNKVKRLIEKKKSNENEVYWVPNFLPPFKDNSGAIEPISTSYFVVTEEDFNLLKNNHLTRSEFITYLILLKGHKYDKPLSSQLYFKKSTIAKKLRRVSGLTVSKHMNKFKNFTLDGKEVPLIEEDRHWNYDARVEAGEEASSKIKPIYNIENYNNRKGLFEKQKKENTMKTNTVHTDFDSAYLKRTDVIDKYFEMEWGKYTSAKSVADLLGVSYPHLTTTIKRNFKEFKKDGVRKLTGWDLNNFKKEHELNGVKSCYLITKRAIIRLCMLFKRSNNATLIRDEIRQSKVCLNEELTLIDKEDTNNIHKKDDQTVIQSQYTIDTIKSCLVPLMDEIAISNNYSRRMLEENKILREEITNIKHSISNISSTKDKEIATLEKENKLQKRKIRKLEKVIADKLINEIDAQENSKEDFKPTVLKMDRNGNLEKYN
ncbi:hypothetical protein QJS65_10755 [Bacillus altitudinis]|uniref:hypothetical protein n=1 Tax=Bacillus altitudinis TaxID=293387 RepID=UPI0024A822FD|nr:hypothetical protein [Bacillus altitudinis]WHF25329.1 hypothetical protein QJS65_10755 [Bacillus altitudinis]